MQSAGTWQTRSLCEPYIAENDLSEKKEEENDEDIKRCCHRADGYREEDFR